MDASGEFNVMLTPFVRHPSGYSRIFEEKGIAPSRRICSRICSWLKA
jgi:hypothetical protein